MKQVKSKLTFLAVGGIAIITAFSLGSCSKSSSSGPTGPTPIGGYTSSDSVAAANLVSYFPFDGTSNDTKGGESGTTVGATFTTGIRGQAYQGATGAYATVPASSAFANLGGSFSLSVWFDLPAQQPSVRLAMD